MPCTMSSTSTRATGIDPSAHLVTAATGEPVGYDKVLLATGASPRLLPLPGAGPHRMPADQLWFWTKHWQQREREVDGHIAAGRITVHQNADDFFDHLDTVADSSGQ